MPARDLGVYVCFASRPRATLAFFRLRARARHGALLSEDGVFLLIDIETTDDPMDNEGPLTLFKLGMSLRFYMTTAMGQGGDGMGTVGLSQSVLNELCESVGFTKVNKIPIRHPLNSLFEIQA